ncbi:hypothetical protein HH215_14305 [Cohnella herbarum]|uniref:Uncharacterized protein n=1 Tax=Cohnella herbarum TaxID=2728023 RepID=A0A7Z2VRE8_9BACL|nr:hypothetical protein HH215_14305 [Cohnella herbarum]
MRASATYKKLIIDVPEAVVSDTVPETMFFYMDTRFTTTQMNRMKRLIGVVLSIWFFHYQQKNEGAILSAYQSCVNKYAKFNLSPVWFEGKLSNGAVAADVQMDGLTTMIAANGFGRAAKAYIMYQASGTSTIKGVSASEPEKNSLTITVNSTDLNNTGITDSFLGGSLLHAWLHREGYRHPAGKFTSYFAGEAAMCGMRGNKDKSPLIPISTYTKWLD